MILFFGNTEKVAKAIGAALGDPKNVSICRVNEMNQDLVKDLQLLVVGSPTRAFSPTPAIKTFVRNLPGKSLEGVKFSAFDTRMKIDERTPGILRFFAGIFGFAAKPILDGLVRKGGIQVMPADGELDRAAEWAKRILKP